jgi:NADPH2:quinone reductase
MRAIVCTTLGGPEVLALQDLPEPGAPGSDEVLVRAHAWGVNYVDVLMCRGGYQLKPDPPFVPGMEAAGEILAIGAAVAAWSVGDRVVTQHRPGAFQEMHVVKASALWPMPKKMNYAAAAGFRSAAMTAYHAMVDRGRLQSGETILVHGATGGVGLAAVQLGKALGATVIATGANPAKLATVQAMGADHVLASAAGFRDSVKALTDGRGVDLVYDPVGGDVFDESLRCLAWEGRIIVVGFVSGRAAEAKTNHLLIKGASVIGIRAGEGARQNPKRGAASKAAILELAETGKLDPHISHQFPLEDAGDAFRAIDAREVIGKAVLTAGG